MTRVVKPRMGAMLPFAGFASLMLISPLVMGATGLPFSSSFETGDFSEWNGGQDAGMSVTSGDSTHGNFATQATMTQGQPANNYKEYLFGDHMRVGGQPVTNANGVWLRLDSKFASGFAFGSSANLHKIALINFEDEDSRRRYQIIINVWTANRQYVLEHLKWNADRSFNRSMQDLDQNVGQPVAARLGQWDRLTLFLRPNTPGNLDGEVLFWVNGQLKAEYRGITLREATTYNPNKLLMVNYATDTTTSGVQKWDNFYLGESNPQAEIPPSPPEDFRIE